ncbi:unnamed protein product [Microthlaspi erraticum]|uniref:Aspartic peptidase DDI1-type domain-containing protein n=1 Tax=Microthlaspi erraticum TaxID=1685480 RepID=A0A6D2IRA4_9BRAS|nr:unnamed protein product [Microthlaspi erraticum]
MLQEYLRNQEESTKKMERRIDFIHESLGNKSEVLFKQVIKLDEDIKKLREDHDRSLTLVKLDVASKYQELLNKSMRIEDTSYGNSKHLGSIYNRLQALEGSSHANYKRERSPTPNHPPFYCNAITRRSTTQVHEDNEEEEREYEEQLNDEDEEQSIDINASPKQSMDTPSPKTLVSHQEVKLLHFQDWKQCKDHHHLLKKKILGSLLEHSGAYGTQGAWRDLAHGSSSTGYAKEEGRSHLEDQLDRLLDQPVEFLNSTSWGVKIHQLFRKARFPIAPHGVNQPPSPPSSPPPQCQHVFQTSLAPLPIHHFLPQLQETPEDIKELFEKAKVQPTFKTLYKIEDPGQFSIPCQVNGHYFDRTLCDSGSCINLMPTQTAKLLGITRLQPAQISIGLANHTIAKPRGVVVDVLLEIGDIKIPVDFHVINIQGGCDTPLILGRPFLATAGAVMDLPNRRMSLANVTRQSFTRPYHSSHQTSCLTSSLPKAAQESHQTTLKVTMRQELKDYVSGRALTPSPTKRSYQSS